jgi:hypothetical protein
MDPASHDAAFGQKDSDQELRRLWPEASYSRLLGFVCKSAQSKTAANATKIPTTARLTIHASKGIFFSP